MKTCYPFVVMIVVTLLVGSFLRNVDDQLLQDSLYEEIDLVQNSGFEEGTTEPFHWSITHPFSKLELYWDRAVRHQGKASICIHNRDEYKWSLKEWQQCITDFPVNRELILTGYMRTRWVSTSGSAGIWIRVMNAEGEVVALLLTKMIL